MSTAPRSDEFRRNSFLEKEHQIDLHCIFTLSRKMKYSILVAIFFVGLLSIYGVDSQDLESSIDTRNNEAVPCGEEMCGEHEHCEDDKCMCGEHECEEGHECEENHDGEKECIEKEEIKKNLLRSIQRQ